MNVRLFMLIVFCCIGSAACSVTRGEERLTAGPPLVLKHPPINKSIGNPVHCLSFLDDGALLATGATSGVHVWDTRSGELQQTLEVDQRSVEVLVQDPRGQRLVAGGASGVIKVWDARTLKPVATLGPTNAAVSSLAISSDAKVLASASPNAPSSTADEPFAVVLWDLTANELLRKVELPRPAFGATSLSFLQDDKQLVVAQDRTFRLIDVQQGTVTRTIESPNLPRTIGRMAVDQDGGRLATGVFEARLRLWGTRDWKELRGWEAHDKQLPPRRGVSAVSFSADGKYLVSGGLDGQVCVWEASTGRPLLELDGRGESTSGWITGVALAPNNRLLAATHFGGTATLWRLNAESAGTR
jgi:WD40 repeat protein